MNTEFWQERWVSVSFDVECLPNSRLEVSNWGRLRTFNKISNGKIISGSVTNGYRIVRMKLFKPEKEKDQKMFEELKSEILQLEQDKKALISENINFNQIKEISTQIEKKKRNLSKKRQINLKKRTIYFHGLVHRLVAQYFLPKPLPNQVIVAHKDYDKLNNKVENLVWMTKEENLEHQSKSPFVIAERKKRKVTQKDNPRSSKLTETEVMLMKKQLRRGKPIKQIAKNFQISNTQIIRIKKGENWGHILVLD